MAADGYRFHRSYHDALKNRNAEERLALYDAMNAYAFDGIDTEFDDPNLAMAWGLIKPNIDSSLKRSQTNSKNARKTNVKTNGKTIAKTNENATAETTGKTNEKTTVFPDSIGKEGIGEDVFLPIGKEEIPSSTPGSGAAAASAAPPLPDGWHRTGIKCGVHRGVFEYRSPDDETICPKCHPELFPPKLLSRINAEGVVS